MSPAHIFRRRVSEQKIGAVVIIAVLLFSAQSALCAGQTVPTVTKEEAKFLKEIVELSSTDRAEAVKLLSSSITRASSAALDFALGNLLLRKGDASQAELSYRAAIKKFPSFTRARANLGRALILQEKTEEAVQVFKPLLIGGDLRPETLTLIGYTFLLQGESVPAESAYRRAILLKPSDSDAYLGLAKCLLEQERYKEALRLLKNLIDRKPSRGELWVLAANVSIALDKTEEAIVYLECARRLDVITNEALATLGDLYLNSACPSLASSAYRQAFSAQAPSFARLLRAIEGFVMLRRESEAAVLFKRAAEVVGQSLVEPGQRCKLYRLKAQLSCLRGDYDGALASYRRLLREDPLDGATLVAVGDLHRQMNRLEEAVIAYEKASRIKGREAEALLRQAQVEVERGRFARAVELLEHSLVFRHQPGVERYLKQVRRLVR